MVLLFCPFFGVGAGGGREGCFRGTFSVVRKGVGLKVGFAGLGGRASSRNLVFGVMFPCVYDYGAWTDMITLLPQ